MSHQPSVGPAAAHETAAVAVLMLDTIQALTYYNDRAIRAELEKYNATGLRTLLEGDPQAVLVARDHLGLIGFCVSRFDDGTIWLSWFGTAARARGRGVGAALLAALAKTNTGTVGVAYLAHSGPVVGCTQCSNAIAIFNRQREQIVLNQTSSEWWTRYPDNHNG